MSDILRKIKFALIALPIYAVIGQTAFADEKIISTEQAIEKKKVSPVSNNSALFAKMALHTTKKPRPQNRQYLLNETMPYSKNETE